MKRHGAKKASKATRARLQLTISHYSLPLNEEYFYPPEFTPTLSTAIPTSNIVSNRLCHDSLAVILKGGARGGARGGAGGKARGRERGGARGGERIVPLVHTNSTLILAPERNLQLNSPMAP